MSKELPYRDPDQISLMAPWWPQIIWCFTTLWVLVSALKNVFWIPRILSEDAQINILLYLYDYSPYPFWDVKLWLSCKPAISHGLVFPIWNSHGDQAEAKSSWAVATLTPTVGSIWMFLYIMIMACYPPITLGDVTCQIEIAMQLGLFTVPYTVTAVHLTVSIRPLAVPYLSCTHLFESPCQYGMVTIMAVYGSRWVVQDSIV